MRTIGIPAAGMMMPIRQLNVFHYNPIPVTALQTIAHDLAVTTPQRLDVFNMIDRIGAGRLEDDFLKIMVHSGYIIEAA